MEKYVILNKIIRNELDNGTRNLRDLIFFLIFLLPVVRRNVES